MKLFLLIASTLVLSATPSVQAGWKSSLLRTGTKVVSRSYTDKQAQDRGPWVSWAESDEFFHGAIGREDGWPFVWLKNNKFMVKAYIDCENAQYRLSKGKAWKVIEPSSNGMDLYNKACY